MRMRQILWRELVQCRMDYRRFIFLFGAALAYLLIFGVLSLFTRRGLRVF